MAGNPSLEASPLQRRILLYLWLQDEAQDVTTIQKGIEEMVGGEVKYSSLSQTMKRMATKGELYHDLWRNRSLYKLGEATRKKLDEYLSKEEGGIVERHSSRNGT